VNCTGAGSFEVKFEADSNDITEYSHNDQPKSRAVHIVQLKVERMLHSQVQALWFVLFTMKPPHVCLNLFVGILI